VSNRNLSKARRLSGVAGPVVLIISLDLALVGLVGAKQGVLGLYEPDIYGSVAPYTWPALFGSLVLPLVVFFIADRRDRLSPSLIWWLLISFVIAIVGLTSVPLVRYPAGYDRWDSWYHFAEAKVILTLGHASAENFYPATHLVLAQLVQMVGISPVTVFRAIPPALSGLLVATVFGTCEWIGMGPKGSFVAAVAASSLVGLPFVLPISVSLLFLVVLLGLLAKPITSIDRSILVLVCFAAVVVAHLLTAISVVIGLLAYLILAKQGMKSAFQIFLMTVVVLLTWIFWMTTVYAAPLRLISQVVATGAFRSRDYSQVLATVGLSGVGAVLVVGAITLSRVSSILLAAPAGVSGFRHWVSRSPEIETRLGLWASANLVFFLILGVFFGTGTIGDLLDRFVNFGLFGIVLLSGMSLVHWSRRSNRSRSVAAALCVVVIAGQVAFFYPSPLTARYNWETGSSDVTGLSWFSVSAQPGQTVDASDYNHAILSGLIGTGNATALGLSFGMELPRHLGCPPVNSTSANYLIVTSFDLFVFSRRGEILESDVRCIQNSGNWNLIYDNGAFWVFNHE